jgi:GT2 family glycosyltransferase
LKNRFANLKVFRDQSKLGVSRAFNKAIQISECDIVLIQGGDDISLPDRREIQTQALSNGENSLAYSDPIVINESGLTLSSDVAPEFRSTVPPLDHLVQLFYFGNYICAPSVGIRRRDFQEWGGFKANLDALQDYELWLRAADSGSFSVASQPVVKYRKHGTNLSRSDFSKQFSHRRHRAELPFILSLFLGKVSEKGLERLLAFNSNSERIQGKELAQIAVKLNHPERLLRLEGIRNLFELSIREEFDSTDLIHFNDQISKALSFTDPDNLVSLKSALANLRNLDADLQRIWESGGA